MRFSIVHTSTGNYLLSGEIAGVERNLKVRQRRIGGGSGDGGSPVVVNVYDLHSELNGSWVATTLGFGAYHTGVSSVAESASLHPTTVHPTFAQQPHAHSLRCSLSTPPPRRYTFCESGIVSHRPRACGGTATCRDALEVGSFGGSIGSVELLVGSPTTPVAAGDDDGSASTKFEAGVQLWVGHACMDEPYTGGVREVLAFDASTDTLWCERGGSLVCSLSKR